MASTPMAKGVGDGLEIRPLFTFCSGCVCRKGPQVRGWPGSEGRRHFFSPLLTLNTLYLFLCLVSGSGHILWLCPNVQLPPISWCWVHPCSFFLLSPGFSLFLLQSTRCFSSSGFWPAGLSISVCLPRIHGGRTRRLSPGLRSRTFSLLFLTQPHE